MLKAAKRVNPHENSKKPSNFRSKGEKETFCTFKKRRENNFLPEISFFADAQSLLMAIQSHFPII